MRNPALVLLVVYVFLLAACGRVSTLNSSRGQLMSETDAMETLKEMPMEEVRGDRAGQTPTYAGLEDAINAALQSGQVKNVRAATGGTGTADLSGLTQILSLLQGGGATNLLGLASGMVNLNGGSTTTTNSKLNSILTLLNAVAPIIATIAPQYAPIIQAIVTIVPLVITFINMFKKPTTTTALPVMWLPIPA